MSVRVELVGRRIHLWSPYTTPGLGKQVPGALFNTTGGPHWRMPLTLEVCTALRQRFGADLQIGPALWAWARDEKARRADMLALAGARSAELVRLPEIAPKLVQAMSDRPYQMVGVRYIAQARQALLGDTVGLGKTLEVLGGVLEAGIEGPYLVVCPKTAVEVTWAPEIHRWLPDHDVVTVPEGRAKRDAILNTFVGAEPASLARTWVVVHPAAVRAKSWWICRECGSKTRKTTKPKTLVCGHPAQNTKTVHEQTFPQLFARPWSAIIADESDEAIIRLSGTPNMTRNGMELLRDAQAEDAMRVAASGTPFRSRPQLLWSTLNWLRPKEYTGFWRWVERYWELGGYSGYEIGKFIGGTREEELWRSLDTVLIRRTRQEVRADLPTRNYIGWHLHDDESMPKGVWIPMDPKQQKAYGEMVDVSVAKLESGELSAVGHLAELTRLKQFASTYGRMVDGEFEPALPSNKFDYLVQLLVELGFPDDPQTKVVVASHFTKTLELFDREIRVALKGLRTALITGKVSQAARTRIIADFEDVGSPTSLMFLNTKAGGKAITLDAADVMVILDETEIDDDQEQLEGRIDNRNPERKIKQRDYYYLRSIGTVEEPRALHNLDARLTGRRLLDERRGVGV
jgi:hypothetical protein